MLADSHRLRVLALDAPGFGQSPAIEVHCYRPQELVDLIPPMLEALGYDHAGFMGFSWGADLGCHLAARHPSALTALVLLDAGYSDPPLDSELTYEQRVAHYEAAARGQPREPSVSAAVVAAVEHGMAQAPPSLLRPQLADSRLPVLLIVAGDAHEQDLRRFAADVPQAEIIRAEKAGHDVLAEGGHKIVDVIGAWLEEIDLP
jgi:pimeloyl-ACP methyl ester carboxylesterase